MTIARTTLAAVALAAAVGLAGQPSQPHIVLPCKVVHVHDGDTLAVEVTLRANVRLLDCWAPELREAGGAESRVKLTELTSGKTGMLTIPLGNGLGDSLSFGRVLGRIEIDGKDVSEAMVASGYAKERKPK